MSLTAREYRAEIAALDATIERLQQQRKALFQAMSDAAYVDFKANPQNHYSACQKVTRTPEQRRKSAFTTRSHIGRQNERIERLQQEIEALRKGDPE